MVFDGVKQVIKRQLLLPNTVSRIVKGKDLSHIVFKWINSTPIKWRLWAPEVETYTTIELTVEANNKLIESAILRKTDSNLLLKNMLYLELVR